MNPLISIIIPSYNRALIIGDTIASIMTQSYTDWECIIVDDGSTDNTEEIIASFSKINPSIFYYKRPSTLPKGPNSCRNFGFSKSKGAIVNWFDSDDLYLPDAFQTMVAKFSVDVDVVVAKLEMVDLLSKRKIRESTIQSNQIIEDYFTGKISYYVCGPFWNRLFLEKQKSLFDEKLRNLDDWDFNIRMVLQNPKIVYLDKALIQYQFHENSLSQEIRKFNFEEIQSEIYAREKMLKILSSNSNFNKSSVTLFYSNRCKFFLKEALLQKHPKKYYLLFKTVNLQFKNLQFKDALKTVFGFAFFSVFNKGYKLIKL
jgi:glycosyltransferase involved in cell wall biosynthesis